MAPPSGDLAHTLTILRHLAPLDDAELDEHGEHKLELGQPQTVARQLRSHLRGKKGRVVGAAVRRNCGAIAHHACSTHSTRSKVPSPSPNPSPSPSPGPNPNPVRR